MKRKRLRRSLWLPPLLLAYCIAMTAIFGRQWIEAGHTWRLVATTAFEVIIIALLWWALIRKEKSGI